MFAQMKTKTRVVAGFGIAILIAASLGIFGWNRLAYIEDLVAVSNCAARTIQELLNARRQEKDFMLRGFETDASDPKNSVQKWEDSQRELLVQLDALRLSPVVDHGQQALITESLSAATEYGKSFALITASRTAQEKAMEEWKNTGWALTRSIDGALSAVINPNREAAEKAKDAQRITYWAHVGHDLEEKIVKPFLVLRTTAVYFFATKADKEWDDYQAHLDKTKAGATAWIETASGHPDLQKTAQDTLVHLDGYEAAGKRYHAAALQARAAEAVTVAKARAVEENCNRLRAEVNDRVTATMKTATMTMIGMAIAAVLVGSAFAVAIVRTVSKALGALIAEANRLSQAAVEGKLQTRGNPELVGLEFRPIIQGVNDTLDAVIGPLHLAAEYVDRIAKGDIPPKITDTFHGDFNEVKNNLNQCIDALSAMTQRGEIGQAFRRMANKNFSELIERDFPGIYGELRENVNLVTRNTREVIDQISESANQFADGAQTVADGSQTLARGAQRRAPASKRWPARSKSWGARWKPSRRTRSAPTSWPKRPASWLNKGAWRSRSRSRP